ncbi:MAG: hypothetical protein ACRCX1_05400 [Bacteroidales bacterium]
MNRLMPIKQFKPNEQRIVRWRPDDSFIVKSKSSGHHLTNYVQLGNGQ